MSSAKTKKYESGTEIEVRDSHFHKVAEARLDSKRRLVLGKVALQAERFNVCQNELGQIMLDPVISIPLSEVWIFQDPQIRKDMQAGLEDARAGRIRKVKESEL
jgi:hypothetical protein